MIALNEPLSDQEIVELDEFLMSDATPEESMNIVELDGFLTSVAIGPDLVPPSTWLKSIWGGKDEPNFESWAQALRVISLIMRRFNTLSFLFQEPPEFAPILWEREVEGTTYPMADDWCWGFMAGVSLASEAWQPLLADSENRAMLRPIVTLGTEEGWQRLEADIDPDGAEHAAFEGLESSVIAIDKYWRKQGRERSAALRQVSVRPRSVKVGRNDPCPCGSGRKYKRCCADADSRCGKETKHRERNRLPAARAAMQSWPDQDSPLASRNKCSRPFRLAKCGSISMKVWRSISLGAL